MELNDIKKGLYKQNPNAILTSISSGVAYYSAHLLTENCEMIVYFAVPVNDMGTATFLSSMDSKYLIRWITSFRELNLKL
jgi:hypothetical protein